MVILSGRANINKVKGALRKSLPAWQDNPPPRSDLYQLGILSAEPITTSAVSGRVWLTEGWGRVSPHRAQSVDEWLPKVLGDHPDIARKLAAHPDVAERHAFIWTTPSSGMAVQVQLEPGDDNPLPVTAPTLPSGVTHVWVAGPLVPRRTDMVSWPRLAADSIEVVIRGSGNLAELGDRIRMLMVLPRGVPPKSACRTGQLAAPF
jgi:hypothetical protein